MHSTDGTGDLLPELGVPWLTPSQRLGVGGAVRAGIRYAIRAGYDFVVRDRRRRASIERATSRRLLHPVASGRADAALGSRFLARPSGRAGVRRLSQSVLAACLSVLTRRRVTDPTSGFWSFGPRALRLLAQPSSSRLCGARAPPALESQRSARGLRFQSECGLGGRAARP